MISLSREITILSKLKFPSIINFIGHNKRNFKDQLKPTIITEFVKNQSLEEIIVSDTNSNNSYWNDTKKLITIYGIASAMSYLHSMNIIHRDLKPANIFLDEFLYPKIGDFGLSKEEEEETDEDTDEIVGTFLYMAPEILTKNKYYKASDVYSFALIIYYIITIKQPYKEFKCIDIIQKVPKGIRPEFTSCISNCYKELIEKCWSNDYRERPTFDEIVHTLKTNKEFITDDIDEDEFINYIEYIESSSNNNKEKFHQVSFDIEHFKELKRIEEIEKVKSLVNEPFLDLNNYEKGCLILENANSKIYEAKNKETGVLYAAKMTNNALNTLLPNDVINLSHEVSVISKLNHSTLLKFIGYSPVDFNDRQKSVIVSEIPSSCNLSLILDKERNNVKIDGWNDTQKLICLYGIALGMSILHSNGIIHRNLNTESVFFDENLFPKIGNFELFSKFHNLTNQTIINLEENLLFSSPELLISNEYSKSCDVYAFSLIVFELMTLQKPFQHIQNLKELINEVVTNSNRPKLNDSIPESYIKLIKSCWSQDPSSRPTFDQIVSLLKSDIGFITEKVNKEIFENYVKKVDNENSPYGSKLQTDNASDDHENECNKKNAAFEEEEEVSDQSTDEISTKLTLSNNEEESNNDDINKANDAIKKRKNKRKRRKPKKSKANQSNYLEIEDENNNYEEQLKKINESIGSEDQVLKISFKFSTIGSLQFEISDSDTDDEEKNDYNNEADDNENEKNELNQSRSKKVGRKRRKPKKLRRKQKNDQDEIEEDNSYKIDDEEDRIRKEDEVRPKKRKMMRYGNEERKFKNEEEWLKSKIEELFNDGDEDDGDDDELKIGNEEEEIRIEKIGERLRKENEERLKKEKEEKDRKEKEERLRKENEERLKKEKEEKARRENEERLKKDEERLKIEKEEKTRKENEERLKKEKEEKLKKEKLEKIKREKEEKIRKERERIIKEREEKARKEEEERLRKEEEERLKKEKEEKLKKEEEERLKKKEEASKLITGKDDNNNTAYAKILSKYKNVEDVVIMQLDSAKDEDRASATSEADTKMKPNLNQLGSPLNKSPRRQKESSPDLSSKKVNSPPTQKVKTSPDRKATSIHSNAIKLTVTLKDIGMEEFESKDNDAQVNEGHDSPSRNQTKNDKELPKLNNFNKYSNQNQINANSPSTSENKLPKLLKNHSNISMQNDQNQINSNIANDNKFIRSPRRNREKTSNYDPSIFYSPPSKTNKHQNKPIIIDELIKSPIKLKVTLKDIGMEGFDSSTPNKTQKLQECEKQSDQKDDERPRSRRYQRPD